MRRIFKHIAICSLTLLSLSCTKEIHHEVERSEKIKEITLTATLCEETRTMVKDGGSAVYWEPGDELDLFYGEEAIKMTATTAEPSTTTSFIGEIIIDGEAGDGGTKGGINENIAVYPHLESTRLSSGNVTTSLPATQYGRPGSFARNTYIVAGKSETLAMGFYAVCGGMRFSVTRDDITKVTLASNNNEKIAADEFSFYFSNGKPQAYNNISGYSEITLVPQDGGCFVPGEWYYIVALPTTLQKGYSLTFENDKEYAVLLSKASLEIKRGHIGSLPKADENLSFSEKRGMELVDLGLSVKWASCNLGASRPEASGEYYIWPSAYDYDGGRFLKYNIPEIRPLGSKVPAVDNGIVQHSWVASPYDLKTSLDDTDDMAQKETEGVYRIPSVSEWEELAGECDWIPEEINGIQGYRVTSRKAGYTDKSIFLPIVGAGPYNSEYSMYHSSTLSDFCSLSYVMVLMPEPISHGIYICERVVSLPIRPVSGKRVAVQSLSIDKHAISIPAGSAEKITPCINPAKAEERAVKWESGNKEVAIVAYDGTVLGISAGNTVITATSIDGSFKEECTVTVTLNQEETVDMGLSVKWSVENLGAEHPYAFGHKYLWGSTNDVDYIENNSESYYILENHILPAGYGTNGGKTTLADTDDPASALGTGWHTPTAEECRELANNSIVTTCLFPGQTSYCYLVAPKEGGPGIILPMDCARFMTSSLNTDNNPICFDFEMNYQDISLGAFKYSPKFMSSVTSVTRVGPSSIHNVYFVRPVLSK